MTAVTAWKIIQVRNSLMNNDYKEAWHHLYAIADPDQTKFNPWEEMEEKAKEYEKEVARKKIVDSIVALGRTRSE